MRIGGEARRTIWLAPDRSTVRIIDQARLPHEFEIVDLRRLEDAAVAIETMQVRGAPLIGTTAAYGVALGMAADPSGAGLTATLARLARTRPTAVNLAWALERMRRTLDPIPERGRAAAAFAEAQRIADEDVALASALGEQGVGLIARMARANPGRPVNVLTHCNAGWLATVDWGTATAPVYKAHRAGVPVHVWVDETRPRNQGAALTAFELLEEGVPHTVIADNVGGHLMQHGKVDLVIVGTDRTTRTGDVANKIGTYLKALAAHDNGIPFYVALPSTTIDWTLEDGVRSIPIEERDGRELSHVRGRTEDGGMATVAITPAGSPVGNWAFDVTPARLVTGLITERGLCPATAAGLADLFPEQAGVRAA